MILMIGGAFQGKLDFAREHLGVADCFTCDGPDIDFSCGCVRKIETFAACHEVTPYLHLILLLIHLHST